MLWRKFNLLSKILMASAFYFTVAEISALRLAIIRMKQANATKQLIEGIYVKNKNKFTSSLCEILKRWANIETAEKEPTDRMIRHSMLVLLSPMSSML
jgi:hypothetical protein